MAQPATLESQRLYSLEEFERFELPNDDNNYELIDGIIKMTPPAGFQHAKIEARIVRHIVLFDPDSTSSTPNICTGPAWPGW